MIKEFNSEYRIRKDTQTRIRQKIFKTIFNNKISGNLFIKRYILSDFQMTDQRFKIKEQNQKKMAISCIYCT